MNYGADSAGIIDKGVSMKFKCKVLLWFLTFLLASWSLLLNAQAQELEDMEPEERTEEVAEVAEDTVEVEAPQDRRFAPDVSSAELTPITPVAQLSTDAICQQIGPWCLVAACESSLNPAAINPADPVTGSYGLLQFKIATATWVGNHYGGQYALIAQRNPLDWSLSETVFMAEGLRLMAGVSQWGCGFLYGADGCYNGFCRTYPTVTPPPPPPPTPTPTQRTQVIAPPDVGFADIIAWVLSLSVEELAQVDWFA